MLLYGNLILEDPGFFAMIFAALAVAIVIGVSFHEFSHAAAANMQGDMTATRLGRLTLDPRKHFDRAGTILLVLVGFGWGRPVPVDPRRLRTGRVGIALVSVAGPAANVAVAIGFALLFRIGLLDTSITRFALESFDLAAWASMIGWVAVKINLVLAVFNLLPIPPLDGGGILAGIAPRQAFPLVRQVQRIGPFVLLLLVLSTFATDWDVLGTLLSPADRLADAMIGL